MDKRTFQESMTYLAAAYGMELSRERAAVYWDQLGTLDGRLFGVAVKTHVGHSRRFPTVADLREHYRDALGRRALAQRPRLPQPSERDRRKAKAAIVELRKRLRP